MDTSFYKDINHFAVHTAWLHEFMKVFAVYGVGIFGALVLAAWWLARYRPEAAGAVAASAWAAVGTLVAVALNQPLAHAVARPRPYNVIPGVEVLVSRAHDFSFPSDHAVTAGAAAAGLWIVAYYGGRGIRGLAIGGTVLALLVAFSRVYVGAHYPGDVAAGLGYGAAISLVGWAVLHRLLARLADRAAGVAPVRPLIVGTQQGTAA
ncbi:MAG TPA: phosphatase PAP2 family protein [Acidimicrobiales bacterium]|nr:phosphatase PAP2 family protein [Acidimicrobiales bacterium]